MKVLAATVVASLLSVVSAQTSLANLPQCAQSCVGNGLSSTGCNLLDIKCICGSSQFIAQISCCIKTACNDADQATTIKFASQLCASAGITVPNNAAAACAQVSGASSTAPAPESTTAAAPAASSEASVAASAAASAGATSPVVGTNATYTSATLTAGTTAAATKTAASTSATGNSGSQLMASGMGLVGAAFAALALL